MTSRYPSGQLVSTPPTLDPARGNAADGIYTLNQYADAVSNGVWPGFDPDFPQTVLLLHGNGADGAQNNTFLDGSANNFTVTRNGNTTQGTFSPFSLPPGQWSNYFDGTGDTLTVAANAALDLTGDFTIEYWCYMLSSRDHYVCNGTQSGSGCWRITLNSSTGGAVFSMAIGSWAGVNITTATGLFTNNQWVHVAVTRSGSDFRFFINGQVQASTTNSGALINTGRVTQIGYYTESSGTYYSNWYLTNLRIIKGSAVYTSDFTPQTVPLTAVLGTSLLTCQSNRFVDNSSNSFTVTPAGDVRVTPFSPFAPAAAYSAGTNGGSGYFDGTGDYLTLSPGAAFQFDTGAFTVEAWAYLTSAPAGQYIIDARNSGQTSTWAFLWGGSGNAGRFGFYDGSTMIEQTSVTTQANVWNHLVAVRSGTTLSVYINGSRVATAANSRNINTSPTTSYIGIRFSLEGPMTGYLSDVRVVKGSAIYDPTQTSISVPTAPLTAITNTSLLLNYTNAGIIDSTARNNLETLGNAQIDTTVKKFGSGSLEFDGISGTYIRIPSTPDLQTGSGNFTVECWVYRTSNAGTSHTVLFLGGNSNASAYAAIRCNIENDGTYALLCSENGTSWQINAGSVSGANPQNTWAHVAIVRNGNTVTLYSNGISVVSGTLSSSSASLYAGVINLIGDLLFSGGGDFRLRGYIDDLRITKGIARYTANFAPVYLPTAPLPLQGGAYAANTVLMLPGTGTNGAQNNTFLDSSTNNFTITRNGNTTQGTFTPFSRANGCWANYFDGVGDYLSAPNNVAFQFGTGDLTIEAWIYISGNSAQNPDGVRNASICSAIAPSSVSNDFWFIVKGDTTTTGTGINFRTWNSGVGANVIDLSFTITQNTWHHVAVTRSGNTITLYFNGTSQGTATYTGTITAGANPLLVGFSQTGGVNYQQPFLGYISNLRIVKGSVVYTTNFTPTGPLTSIANTSLLTCQSNRFVDNSTNNFAVTSAGDVRVTAFGPFADNTAYSPSTNGGSGYFDGTGDYLNIASNSATAMQSNNFTLEFWVYLTNSNANALQTFYSNYTTFASAGSIYFGKHSNTSGRVAVWISNFSTGGPLMSESTQPPNNSWTHYALVRNGNTISLYRNGTLSTSASFSGAVTGATNPNFISAAGDAVTSYNTPGYFADYRLVVGTAVYTSDFTPPTAPLTAITNTSLLLNYTNAGIADASMTSVAETVNQAQVSTAVSRWGSGSLYFDGTGDYLVLPNTQAQFAFGTGNFTIEAWVYMNTLPSGNGYPASYWIVGGGPANSNTGFDYAIGSTNLQVGLSNFTSLNINVAHGMSAGIWYFLVLCRQGNTLYAFRDGVLLTSASVSGVTADPCLTGLAVSAAEPVGATAGNFNGYIQDLRIIKGAAIVPQPWQTSQWQDQGGPLGLGPPPPPTTYPATFSISPAVSGKTTWNIDVDGPLDLATAGTWTLTPTISFTRPVRMWGAGGGAITYGNTPGGGGGAAFGYVSFESGVSYDLIVGSGGAGAAGDRNGAGGGAGTGIQKTSGAVAVLVAGGGGGGHGGAGRNAGAGGGFLGEDGGGAAGGKGGSQTAAGAGGVGSRRTGSSGSGRNGGNGAGAQQNLYAGGTGFGNGGGGARDAGDAGSGGGGGGYFGGGGGGGDVGGFGGGGGSGYYNASLVSGAVLLTGVWNIPGNSSDPDRGTAGDPGNGTTTTQGSPGKILIS